jgi:hypothetical protein
MFCGLVGFITVIIDTLAYRFLYILIIIMPYDAYWFSSRHMILRLVMIYPISDPQWKNLYGVRVFHLLRR